MQSRRARSYAQSRHFHRRAFCQMVCSVRISNHKGHEQAISTSHQTPERGKANCHPLAMVGDLHTGKAVKTKFHVFYRSIEMSKQQKAKEAQEYTPKAQPKFCSACMHYRSEFVTNQWNYVEEKAIRCGIGGFVIKKQGTCNKWETKQ